MEGHVEWTMPAPLWTSTGDPSVVDNRLKFRTPAILRFATDTFMQDFLNLLSTQPYRLSEFLAAPETWNSPPNEPVPSPQASGLALTLFRARERIVTQLQARGSKVIGQAKNATPVKTLKLFQPSHQRYYLVTTCLVCRALGLPDRRIDAGNLERATFVLRMLQPNAGADPNNPDPRDCTELALSGGAWQVAANPASLIAGEEQKPLSPVSYTEDDSRQRRLLMGVIPVGDRERLLQAKQPNPSGKPALPPLIDSRQMMLKTQVIYPLCTLEDLAKQTVAVAISVAANGQSTTSTITNINNQLQESSWYILLDLARYLETNLNQLWQEIQNNGNGSDLPPALQAILNFLNGTSVNGVTFTQALQQAYAAAAALETVNTTYQGVATGWPNFKFPFYAVTAAAVQYLTPPLDRAALENLIVQALPAVNANPPLPPRTVAQANANPQGPVWFTIRCILERPNCGSLTPPLASEPTAAFQLAAYFDPDAPARPIRIGLPIDTTPSGLRKFDKNTAFVMSDTLCGQVSKLGGMSLGDLVLSVLPFPFHKDLPPGTAQPCAPGGIPGGMVCSFSIPIITIVALILLIIFVKLFDIIFFWMPFFQICLPLPNFTAKD
jgi:hypothetical protein